MAKPNTNAGKASSKRIFIVSSGFLGWSVASDPRRDFSESPVTAVSPGAEGTPLVKIARRQYECTARPIPGQRF